MPKNQFINEHLVDENDPSTWQPPYSKASEKDGPVIEILLYTVLQVAHMLQLSRSTVINLVNNGHLPTIRIGGNVRIASDDLKAFAKTGHAGRRNDQPA